MNQKLLYSHPKVQELLSPTEKVLERQCYIFISWVSHKKSSRLLDKACCDIKEELWNWEVNSNKLVSPTIPSYIRLPELFIVMEVTILLQNPMSNR